MTSTASTVATEPSWPAPLRPYQADGATVLYRRDRLLLADDMGLGKTIQAAAAMRMLFQQQEIATALLVVPSGLLDQWRRELRLWAPELRVLLIRGSPTERAWKWRADVGVKVVSYELLRLDAGNPRAPCRTIQWDLVVLDEAQRIKNADSATAVGCKALQRRRSWALTGTPLENELDDLASIMGFVDQSQGPPVSAGDVADLRARHREVQLRRRKQDVLHELPPKQVINLELSLPPGQRAAYDRAERDGVVRLRELGAELRIQHILELILRLKQLCNADPVTGESAKLADVRERMEVLRSEGHRALVFSQFVDNDFGVGAAARALHDFKPLTFTGKLSTTERDEVLRRFRGEPSHAALILSLRAGGVGINLQEASYVFHLDRWWNPAIERQAEDRSHRMGQRHPVTVFKYTTLGTIEERIDEVLTAKQQLFDEVVDDVSIDIGGRFSKDQLLGIVGIDPGELAAPAG